MDDRQGKRAFDGIICIGGEDWWYHNRGHFDFQIMRRLARRWPVLFVNSLGVRMPSLAHNRVFLSRIGRKLKSLARGLVQVENGFWVYSPVKVPGEMGEKLSAWALAPQIRLAARRAGIRNPLLWVHCPAGASLVSELDPVATVLQRTDRFEAFPEASGDLVKAQIDYLKDVADLAVYANPYLQEEEAGQVRNSLLVTHGVDVQRFASAGRATGLGPADIALLPRPRAGFIGGVDRHTFDPELFVGVAQRLPEVSFVLVGNCSLPAGWCPLPNVTRVGQVPFETVARYMAAMDALIMPWNDSDWIRACNPIKLKEYLAVGRPVVTTDFPALAPYRDLVRVAAGVEGFTAALRSALSVPYDAARVLPHLTGETWDDKADLLASSFARLGWTGAATARIRSKTVAA